MRPIGAAFRKFISVVVSCVFFCGKNERDCDDRYQPLRIDQQDIRNRYYRGAKCRRSHSMIRTVHKRKAEARRRRSKRNKNFDDLVFRMKALKELPMAQKSRAALSYSMHSLFTGFWEARKQIGYRVIVWIFNALWKLLVEERNRKVRLELLALGSDMVESRFFHYHKEDDAFAAASLILVLEKNLHKYELEDATYVLSEIMETAVRHYQLDDVLCIRILNVSLGLVNRSYVGRGKGYSSRVKSYLIDIIENALFLSPRRTVSVSLILNDEYVMTYIFQEHQDEYLSSYIRSLLESLLRMASYQDRVTITVRYHSQLSKIFHAMSFRALDLILRYAEYAGLVATSPTMLHRLHDRLQHRPTALEDDETACYDRCCRIVLSVMSNLVGHNVALLQRMHGFGFLVTAARHFAADDQDAHIDDARKIRRIVAASPEWRSKIREETMVGPAGNMIAHFGRTLLARAAVGEDYVFIGEEKDSY